MRQKPKKAPKLPTRYHPAVVTLHWLTVILLLAAFSLAPEEEGGSGGISIFPHMILGGLLALTLIARLVMRFAAPRPAKASAGNGFFDLVGELTHWGLYILAFALLAGGASIAMQRNLIGALFGSGSIGPMGFSAAALMHGAAWSLITLLLLLHIGAALYHQFYLKDNLLNRMWFGAR